MPACFRFTVLLDSNFTAVNKYYGNEGPLRLQKKNNLKGAALLFITVPCK